MSAFVDTSALLAVLDADAENHGGAFAAWRRELESATPFVTSNYVVVESFALVQRRLGVEAARALVDDLLAVVEIEWVTPEDHRAAMAAVLAAKRRTLSLVDCVSFEVMRRLGIVRAFTLDRHFKEQGFEVLH